MEHCKAFWLLKWQHLYCIIFSWELAYGQMRYSIPEELNLGAFVGNIAEDLVLDKNELSARGFHIVASPSKQYLDVNLDNGNLLVKEKIDREQLCGPALTCTLSLEAVIENPLNVYHFQVEILDVNDNSPRFPESQFRVEISEVAAPGTRFALECAFDPDIGTNSVQNYQLSTNRYFNLDVETRSGDGKLPVLVLERTLDREQQIMHRLVLTAKDGGIPERSGTAEIVIAVEDANDNAPVFPQSVYKVSLLENVPTGSLVTDLDASDLDIGLNGQIVYSFSSHTSNRVREHFALDPKTGEIKTKKNLNYEENSVFEINVQAKDKGPNATPVYCHVVVDIVDVNDNSPEVTLTSLFSPVGEDSIPDTVVALISSTDKDSGENGHVQCQISNSLPFKLDSSLRGYYRLVTRETLDREYLSNYNVTIVCRDGGSPPLTVNKTIQLEISDVNDNPPQFGQPLYTARVMENSAIGESIFSVTAFDPDLNENARLSYHISETLIYGMPASTYVSINSDSGVIYAQRTFDYEHLKNFQIQVLVFDSGEPPLSGNTSVHIIILDQNDNAPVIVHPLPEFGSTVLETVSRFAEPGYLVAKVSATDADSGQNARLTYQILQATDAGLFTISPDTGEIWTIRNVVNKDASKQKLVIGVKDNGIPPLTATVTFMLSVTGTDVQMLSDVTSKNTGSVSDTSFYLVITLGLTSSIFLAILITLAIKVYNRSSLETCGCFTARNSRSGVRRSSRNLQIPANYVEVFGGDPLSQSFRYDTCSSSYSTKRNFLSSNRGSMSARKNNILSGDWGNGDTPRTPTHAQCRNTVISEVKQPNADWRFSQTHRAELNSSQYREEEGVQRDIQREVQREVQCDVQCEAPRDVQCNVPHNIQHEVQRDVPCEVQRVVENEPSGARKPACARPVAIPAGRDGWTLPRTAPRMQLQMTLGPHVPGTLRSQYLIPRELHTSGARISNSSVEFIAPIVGSLHGPWAANQTRDHRGISSSSGRRPELDTQACGQIPGSPSGQRLSTQCLHSRDDHHSLREVNY
ncbi:protocadherin gamma-A10-like isoform X11 [Chiloscyllium plagiosum]|uniref:protocadherin gamma-A10-like isoform X11 n=1 Tax=Chiloscyllium plagiosum TaxID=36176 RepID=UPI001CB7D2D9|nr:protocadherin gamma-A10-like isoform X11 [Chiloscyllium plagiosum]